MKTSKKNLEIEKIIDWVYKYSWPVKQGYIFLDAKEFIKFLKRETRKLNVGIKE